MIISFDVFLAMLLANPLLALVTALVFAAIIVNGATDAPNAIATVVSTRSLSPNLSIAMAAVCNFLGLLLITMVSSSVANTIFKMVDFGSDNEIALWGVAAAMVAIIIWGVVTWIFGIPTSESHALIAGLTGAAIGLQGGLAAINWGEWIKVIYGLGISTLLGFSSGWLIARFIRFSFKGVNRRQADKGFGVAQILAAAGLAFMHGAQDGQKFMSIAMLGITLAAANNAVEGLTYPIWIMVLCSLAMGLGTAVGGRKIIKTVAMEMVSFEKFEGFAASLAGCLCIALATFTGIPVSTTHTKTTAIMGVGAAKRVKGVNWATARDMGITWLATFPGCGIIGFLAALLVVQIL